MVEAWLSDDRAWVARARTAVASIGVPTAHRRSTPLVAEFRTAPPDVGIRGARQPALDLLALLANADDPGLRLTAAMARVGHNHWVLQRIERARQHSQTRTGLLRWVDGVVGPAILPRLLPRLSKPRSQFAWPIIRRAAERTRDARPTPL